MKPPWQVALGLLFLVLPNLSGDTEPNPGEGRSRWEGGWGGGGEASNQDSGQKAKVKRGNSST